MKNRAFTLIELLVVVLIIGILSAIALPQYRKAVIKSKITEALIHLRNISQAQDLYRLANGSCTLELDKLGVSGEGKYYTYRYLTCGTNGCCLYAYSKSEDLPNLEGSPQGTLYCRASAEKCKLIGDVESPSWCGDPCDYYILPL